MFFLAALSSCENTLASIAFASEAFFSDNKERNFFIVFLSCVLIFRLRVCFFLLERVVLMEVLRLGIFFSLKTPKSGVV
jgi:hypothetical protein